MTSFINDESGAITVDWVVLAAGLVALSIATMAVVSSGVEAGATDIDEELSTTIIKTSFGGAPANVPYAPYNQSSYDDGVNAFNTLTSQAEVSSNYESDMNTAYGYVTTGDQFAAQYAIDRLHGSEAAAAAGGYTTAPVTINGQSYDAAGLQAIHDTRFPAS